jgi:hypothetical protein
MPIEEFQSEVRGFYSLTRVEGLAEKFGSSFEATVFRFATAHPGFAVAGLLKYRLRKDEERKLAQSSQSSLFYDLQQGSSEAPTPKYRRQSFFASDACGDEYTIRWNKSFASESCVYAAANSGGICTANEALPNSTGLEGLLEVVRAPFQRDDAHPQFPDLLFFWST